jgi:hypothetical protein
MLILQKNGRACARPKFSQYSTNTDAVLKMSKSSDCLANAQVIRKLALAQQALNRVLSALLTIGKDSEA